jgi:hypothetical protein
MVLMENSLLTSWHKKINHILVQMFPQPLTDVQRLNYVTYKNCSVLGYTPITVFTLTILTAIHAKIIQFY